MTRDQVFLVAGIAAAGLLIGWALLAWSRRLDRRGWILDRAPALPVRVLAVHDDAWIRGVVHSDEPLRCPWFGHACVSYRYQIERKVRRTHRDAQGRTRTETKWVVDHREQDAQPFTLAEGEDLILVRLPQGELHDEVELDVDYETGSRRHSAHILPVGAAVSALGVKLDDRTFGPLREVPLLVTRATRESFLRRTARGETWARRFGFAFPFVGGAAAFLVWRGAERVGPLLVADWVLAALAGLAVLLPIWFVSTYNRLVRTRQQAEAAWRQVDVDLTVRDQLIPQLVSVVEGYRDHEAELFRHAAELRSGGAAAEKIRRDEQVSGLSRQLLLLRERHPELQANALFRDLHDRLWALEEKLAASRTFYNGVCEEWNNLVRAFPGLVVAGIFGHRPRPYFALTDATAQKT